MEKLSASPNSGQTDGSITKPAVNTGTEQSPELRSACSYCLRTLSPQDSNIKLREIVQVENQLYHSFCWTTFLQTDYPHQYMAPYHVENPLPLIPAQRQPAQQGYHHADIKDMPLGISVGTLALNGEDNTFQPHKVTLRNNSAQAIHLSRLIGTAWAFFDFGQYNERSDSAQIVLLPGEERTVEIYSHVARPNITQRMVIFEQDAALLLKSANSLLPLSVAGSVLGISLFAVLIIIYNFIFWFWNGGTNAANVYFLTNAVFFTLLGATDCFFLMPILTLWTAYRVLGRVKALPPFQAVTIIQERLEAVQRLIWLQFAKNRIQFMFQHPVQLFIVSIVVGTITAMISLIIWIILLGIVKLLVLLLGTLGGLLSVVCIGALFYLFFALVLEQYDLRVLQLTRRATVSALRQGRNLVRAVNK